jgi:hypothetical protein
VKLTFLTLALGLGTALLLGVGIYGAVEVGLRARGWLGQQYEVWAFWAAMLVLSGVAAGLYRWQESVLGWLAPLVAGTAPEVMYCQMCGTAVRHDVSFCPQCAGTRFGIARPGYGEHAGRLRVQVGMDVIASDGKAVGVIKRKGAHNFLVSRPWKRDVYVPASAIAHIERATVRLMVTAKEVGSQGWAKPHLLFLRRPSDQERAQVR